METLEKPIALGRTAEIYAWQDGQILKLLREGWPASAIEYEAHIARTVHAAGLPVPAAGEVVKINGRFGLIYERVEGVSMLQTIGSKPWLLLRTAHVLAELHAAMHDCHIPDLPAQRERLERKIRAAWLLSPELQEIVLAAMNRLPEDDRLCHGDFHPDNVLLTTRGPIIIDWVDATRGHPLADVARTSILISTGTPVADQAAHWLLVAGRRWFHSTYLQRYFQLRPDDRRIYQAWLPVVAAARLDEGIAEEGERLLALVKGGLGQGA